MFKNWPKPTRSLVRSVKTEKELGTLIVLLGRGLINSKIRFLKKFVRRTRVNIRIEFVPYYDGKRKNCIFKEALISFNGTQILEVASIIWSRWLWN